MSERATLCIVNLTNQDLTLLVEKNTVSGFESHDPSTWLKHTYLAAGDSLGNYVVMNNGGPCKFKLMVKFPNGNQIACWLDQWESRDKGSKVIEGKGQLESIPSDIEWEIFQTSGGNINDDSHGTLGIYIRSKTPPDLSNWMRDLLNDRPDIALNDLVMPGSHDAGVYTTTHNGVLLIGGGSDAETQNLAVLDQLKAGSRYFDFRVHRRDNGGDYHLAHFSSAANAIGAYGEKVTDALADIQSFLTAHPKEAVILKWSHTGFGLDKGQLVNVIRNGLGHCHYNRSTTLTGSLATLKLSTLSGKALSIFGSEFSQELKDPTLCAHHDAAGSTPREALNSTAKAQPGLTLYDIYAEKTPAVEVREDQEAKLNSHGGLGNHYLFLLSWFATGTDFNRDIEALAHTTHPWLPHVLFQMKGGGARCNVVYLDYINAHLCQLIVALNYGGPTVDRNVWYRIDCPSRYGESLGTSDASPFRALIAANPSHRSGRETWQFEPIPGSEAYMLTSSHNAGSSLTAAHGGLILMPRDWHSEHQRWKLRRNGDDLLLENVAFGADRALAVGEHEVVDVHPMPKFRPTARWSLSKDHP